jgi:hypothetical protein
MLACALSVVRHADSVARHPGTLVLTRNWLVDRYEVHLGLDRVDAALLVLTLFVSALTVHLLLSVVYIALIFSP